MPKESRGSGGSGIRVPKGDKISKKGQEPRPKVPPAPKVGKPPEPPPPREQQ